MTTPTTILRCRASNSGTPKRIPSPTFPLRRKRTRMVVWILGLFFSSMPVVFAVPPRGGDGQIDDRSFLLHPPPPAPHHGRPSSAGTALLTNPSAQQQPLQLSAPLPPSNTMTMMTMMTLEEQSRRRRTSYLLLTKVVAATNIVINSFRPDPQLISWQMKLPRICWEACIWIIAHQASMQHHHGGGVSGAAAATGCGIPFLLLAWMLGTTSLVDIFLWGPLFAALASFESCTGGGWFSNQPRVCVTDYAKGVGRLVASFQSILGGLFYLSAALVMWNAYWSITEDQKVDRTIWALDNLWNHHRRRRQQEPPPSPS